MDIAYYSVTLCLSNKSILCLMPLIIIMREGIKRLCFILCLSICAVWLVAQPSYTDSLVKEQLGRGVVVVKQSADEAFVSWRYLESDPTNIAFDVYRDGVKLNSTPIANATWYVDNDVPEADAFYEVRPVQGGANACVGRFFLSAAAPVGYLEIPLYIPSEGKTPDGMRYGYSAGDASMGDVDGDGEYEIILKWDPSNARDNAHDGYTGNVLIDCYRLTGEKLWRIDLGPNIRAGAHYTQFMVYDLDGDNCAEVVLRTSDGTVDGLGRVIGDAFADYREVGDTAALRRYRTAANAWQASDRDRLDRRSLPDTVMRRQPQRPQQRRWNPSPPMQGRIISGKEYLTVFSGLTGEALHTIDYVPSRGNLQDWGDSKANRSDRFLACVAYLDGIHPSVVMCRGYYTRSVLAAFDWDGDSLRQRWVFDSYQPEWKTYSGQGNHNLRVGDVDGDGCDEIVYGSCAIDHDGCGLYSTGLGHGDAMHMTAFYPDSATLQVWACHENRRDGSTLRDARTGRIIQQYPSGDDVGRCMAADIDPRFQGVEMWSLASGGIRNLSGEVTANHVRGLSTNMAVWWDGDLLRELLDGTRINKYVWEADTCATLANFEGCSRINGTKSNPCLHADILGDWREEVLVRTQDNSALRLYISTIPTDYRFHTFLHDPIYRISIATQNVAYNQPTQPGFYFGSDLKGEFRGTRIP